MTRAASRLQGLVPSPIRTLAEGAPEGTISLGLGEPTWPLPGPAVQALAEQSGTCAYGPNAGLPELRAAVAELHGVEPSEVLVTCGSQEAMYCMVQAWVGPGDRVLVPDPGFPAYAALTRLAGAEPVTYPLTIAGGFRLDAREIVSRLEDPGVKAVFIGHPSNPTGAGASVSELALVARACADRDVLLISDEVYRHLHFGDPTPSLREVADYGVVVESVSKGWGAPGLRVGWVVGERRWLEAAQLVHGYAVTAAARPSQVAALALLEHSTDVLDAARKHLTERWGALARALLDHLGITAVPPDGSFYHWMPIPEGCGGSHQLALRLRDEARVLVVPGDVFGPGGDGHLRLSFAARPDELGEGIRRLAGAWPTAG